MHDIHKLTFLVIVASTTALVAQPPQGFGGRGGPGGFGPARFGPGGQGGPGGPREKKKLVKEFDQDENGWLNREERVNARAAAQNGASERRGFGPPGGPRNRGSREPARQGRRITTAGVEQFPSAGLYEPGVLRTLFFEFENEDWESELENFHGTDVEVPANLVVDGKTYNNVGVRFRGMSSYGMVPTGSKRSFNVSVDLADREQRLLGYKTLNLLNSAGDPSFMSTVLYSHIASQYIPVPKANHVRVVINGEDWGVYVNVQQFNKDFLAEHFESTKGTRWKVSGNPGADGGLRYLGDDLEPYKQRFDMKSNDGKQAWNRLILLCKTLNETPLDQLQDALDPLLNIDEALRFLALDVALVNSDGYWTRASDYSLFMDSDKQFHLIPHDMNEAFHSGHGPGGPRGPGHLAGPPRGADSFGRGGFGPPPESDGEIGRFNFRDQPRGPGGERGDQDRFSGGGARPEQSGNGNPRRDPGRFAGAGRPGLGGPGGPEHGGVDLDPLVSIDNPRMPLRSRLLAVPELRSKYLQYVREIARESLDWKQIKPVIAEHAKRIERAVAVDTKKLDSLEAFKQATSLRDGGNSDGRASLRSFFDQRRQFLLNYDENFIGKSSTN